MKNGGRFCVHPAKLDMVAKKVYIWRIYFFLEHLL